MKQGLLVTGSYPMDACPDSRYKGFDGEFWPGASPSDERLQEGLVPFRELENVAHFMRAAQEKGSNVRLVFVSRSRPSCDKFEFAGFDVGFIETSFNYFSAILNDVLNPHGAYSWMKDELNENRLFDDETKALAFAKLRSNHVGGDAEALSQEQKMGVVAIWLYKS